MRLWNWKILRNKNPTFPIERERVSTKRTLECEQQARRQAELLSIQVQKMAGWNQSFPLKLSSAGLLIWSQKHDWWLFYTGTKLVGSFDTTERIAFPNSWQTTNYNSQGMVLEIMMRFYRYHREVSPKGMQLQKDWHHQSSLTKRCWVSQFICQA